MMTFSVFLSWLDKHTNHEMERSNNHAIDLTAMIALCEATRHPERCAPCVHIAGSKGKGSTSKMVACILEAAGMNSGLYLSPHVSDARERVGWANGAFSEEVYSKAAEEVMEAEQRVSTLGMHATWFELMTLFAFVCFRVAKTDINVIEVGIGGRLDATNVVCPAVTCIMPIEMEHTEWLGNTISEIAREKAGIIKKGVPVIVAKQQDPLAMEVIVNAARAAGSKCINAGEVETAYKLHHEHFPLSASVSFTLPWGAVHTEMQSVGKQMAENAVVASIAAKLAYPDINIEDMQKGLAIASLPARFECFSYSDGRVIIDGAHTVSSISGMLSTLASCTKSASLVFGCASDKDVEDMAYVLSAYDWERVTLTVPGALPRADIARTVAAFNKAGMKANVERDCIKAIRGALERVGKGTTVVSGSFYLAGEARRIISERNYQYQQKKE